MNFISEFRNNLGKVMGELSDLQPSSSNNLLFKRQIGRSLLREAHHSHFAIGSDRVLADPSFSRDVCNTVSDIFQEKISKKKNGNKEESSEFKLAYILNSLHTDNPESWEKAQAKICGTERGDEGLGTSNILFKAGYDFDLTSLTTILHQFGSFGSHTPGRLGEQAEQHMLNTLMQFDNIQDDQVIPGDPSFLRILDLEENSYHLGCPGTGGFIEESENHTWMILSSLYLIYAYKMRNPQLDQNQIVVQTEKGKRFTNKEVKEDLEKRILAFLDYTKNSGFYEFNSRPYVAFTLHALLNLEAFSPSEEIKEKTREVLDFLNLSYAVSSYNGKRFPPFCRNINKAHEVSLKSCHHSTYFTVWAQTPSTSMQEYLGHHSRFQYATIAASLPYRPKQEIIDLMTKKESDYLAQVGHGPNASPEIYYGGNGVLISAGGVKVPGDCGEVVVRPITIILDDGKENLKEVHRLGNIMTEEESDEKYKNLSIMKPGFSSDCSSFNNTGVYEKFACSRAKYFGPNGEKAVCNSDKEEIRSRFETFPLKYGKWKIFDLGGSFLAVYKTEKNNTLIDRLKKLTENIGDLGLIAIFDKNDLGDISSEQLIVDIIENNSDEVNLQNEFIFPYTGKKLTYDVDAPANQWVMISEQEQGQEPKLFNRDFGTWGLLDLNFHPGKQASTTEDGEETKG